jgi:hypothetical protein
MQARKRRRTDIWCGACEMFHRIPKPAKDWADNPDAAKEAHRQSRQEPEAECPKSAPTRE